MKERKTLYLVSKIRAGIDEKPILPIRADDQLGL